MWLCLLLCGVVFVIMWGCVCYCVGLCLLLCGVVFVIVWCCVCYFEGCVCYCMVAVFVNVIFVWLFKFNSVVWDKIGQVEASSVVVCANLRLVH